MEESGDEGSRAIRAVSATTSSTESSETSEEMENILTASDPQHPIKRVTFKDDTHPLDPDRNHESVGMEESRTTPSNEDPQYPHEKEERDDMPGETNFSTRESFELDDFLENSGDKLEAIPVDCVQKTQETHFLICNTYPTPRGVVSFKF